jgi:hypothetical protein
MATPSLNMVVASDIFAAQQALAKNNPNVGGINIIIEQPKTTAAAAPAADLFATAAPEAPLAPATAAPAPAPLAPASNPFPFQTAPMPNFGPGGFNVLA